MDILSFHKITKPIYETGATIDLSPKGMWQVAIRRTDGTYRYPFGEHWFPNLFINRFADGLLRNQVDSFHSTNWAANSGVFFPGNACSRSFIQDYFFSGTGTGRKIAVGSSNAAVSASQLALQNEVRQDSVPNSGNDASINFSNGGITYTISEIFPAETGTVTYQEAAIKQTAVVSADRSGQTINGLTAPGIFNRVVFPGAVTLSAGEALAIKIAITIQSCAGTNGTTITLSAQNGMNISGQLKLIGAKDSILGGTVTSLSATTLNTDYPLLFNTHLAPVGVLSTLTSFSTQDTNPTWGITNPAQGAWSAYSNGTRYRDATFLWSSGSPSTDTAFRSILLRSANQTTIVANTVRGGYQLLLDNEMTKATTATLALSLRFAI